MFYSRPLTLLILCKNDCGALTHNISFSRLNITVNCNIIKTVELGRRFSSEILTERWGYKYSTMRFISSNKTLSRYGAKSSHECILQEEALLGELKQIDFQNCDEVTFQCLHYQQYITKWKSQHESNIQWKNTENTGSVCHRLTVSVIV